MGFWREKRLGNALWGRDLEYGKGVATTGQQKATFETKTGEATRINAGERTKMD